MSDLVVPGFSNKQEALVALVCDTLQAKYGIIDFDPVVALAELAHNSPDEKIQLGALKEIASYFHAKQKTIEIRQDNGDRPFGLILQADYVDVTADEQ
jgi:hypothetical protein